MDMQEWWWLYDANRPASNSSLDEDDVARLKELGREVELKRHG